MDLSIDEKQPFSEICVFCCEFSKIGLKKLVFWGLVFLFLALCDFFLAFLRNRIML